MTTPGDGRTRRSRWPRRLALLAGVAVVGLGAVFGARFGFDVGAVDSPLIGQPAPQAVLPALESEGELGLPEDLAGQVAVVNFWASWCVPCRNEHPALVQAAATYRDQGVTFVGVVFQDREESAVAFLDELGRGYDHYLDPGSRAAMDFGVFGIPETYLLDRDGTIVAKLTGEVDYQLLTSTIEDVLAGRDPRSVVRGPTQSQPGG
ncbi:MAG: redoxin domain-containing protein [Actinobacteria bacterium]|jgi:cytochrome c biogenesis protein CcmG/thiol:disulfide interchange protein DsbE|nr:redoxin domain-containing protein [Actinomycetota bacterium]